MEPNTSPPWSKCCAEPAAHNEDGLSYVAGAIRTVADQTLREHSRTLAQADIAVQEFLIAA